METTRRMKLGTSDKIILGVGFTLLGLFVLAVFIPLVYVVFASFMDPNVLNNQGISFRVSDWTLDAYRRVLENEMIWRGFMNSLFYSAAFGVCDFACGVSDVKKRFCRPEVFQCHFCDHNVFWRRPDSDIYSDQ